MPKPTNGKICYVELPAKDIQKSADFYAKVFGWKIKKRGDGSTAFDDPVGGVSGAWVLKRPVTAKPGLLVYIMVDSISATTAAIVREGGAIMRVHTTEIAHFRDPAGNIIGLYQEPAA